MSTTTPFCQGPEWKPRASTKVPGTCGACGTALVTRQHWFCPSPPGFRNPQGYNPDSCRYLYLINHIWGYARDVAIKRDGGKCRRCGGDAEERTPYAGRGGRVLYHTIVAAEVNHIVPREGAGYGNGCHNHQDGLETLCHKCHVETTTQQGRARRRAASPQYAMEV